MAMKKRRKITRQDWKPNWLLQILRGIWTVAASLVKLAIGAAATVLIIMIVCGFVLAGALGDYLQDDVIPNISLDLSQVDIDQTSFIHYVDREGNIQELQQIYTTTDRQWASIDEIPEDLIHAAVAIEDKRFYEHQGVDWISTMKACTNMFFGSSSTFGGSTITQQTIKNLFNDDDVTVSRKVREIFRAQQFEAQYDKDFVMENYLNYIYFGHLKNGVKSAAWYYFGKDLSDLTTAECASLIGITNNPSLFDPYTRPENNRDRQLTILKEMYKQEWIDQETYEAAIAEEMNFHKGDDSVKDVEYTCTNCGYTASARKYHRDGDEFFCPQCGTQAAIELDANSDMYSWFTELVMDDVAKELAAKQGLEWNSNTRKAMHEQIKKGGYHIYATIDMDVQDAVDSVYTDLSQIPETKSTQQLQSAIVVIDNRSGDIVALSGAVGEKTAYDAISFATDQKLQTGSVMKPLTVYAPAFELGAVSPATVVKDLPLTYSGGKFPLNEGRSYRVTATVLNGIYNSTNTIAVQTLDKIGLDYSFDFAKNKFRLDGLVESRTEENGNVVTDVAYAPLALGALSDGVTVRDMAGAYATFPNNGVYRENRTFTKVYDSEGNLILDNTQDTEQILSEKAANYMNYCLREVVNQGTGWYADVGAPEVAAKTGTTSSNRDRWFIAYTDYYTAAVWCGYKYPEEIRLSGSNRNNPAGRLWVKVMEKVHEGLAWKPVADTSDMQEVSICKDSGGLATSACWADPRGNRVEKVLVYRDDIPDHKCDRHVLVDYCDIGHAVANRYCNQVPGASISSVGLVKYTQAELDEILRAGTLRDFSDENIYLVDENGGDRAFYGIDGDINQGIRAPYKVCTVHDASSLEPTTEPTEEPDSDDEDDEGIFDRGPWGNRD